METTMIPDYARGATPEDVWAALRDVAERQKETDRMMKESSRKWEREMEKSKKEWDEQREKSKRERDEQWEKSKRERDEQWEKSKREWDEQWKKSSRDWDKKMGDLGNRFGELAEHLVAPGIHKRFNQLGYHFSEVAPGGLKIEEDGKIKMEIDLLLQNSDTVMAVEVKSKPCEDDIADHIKRIEILRDHRRKQNDMRQVEGAIAGAVFGAAVKREVIKAGLYVIEQSGDTMKIEVPDGFVPRKW